MAPYTGTGIPDHSYVLYPTSGSNGNMEAKFLYTNIGFDDQGHPLDASVEVSTVHALYRAEINPIGRVNVLGNANDTSLGASVKLQFLIHNTKTPADVTGHLTFSNVNNVKVVSLNFNDFDKFYCTSDTMIEFAPNSNGLTDVSANDWKGDVPQSRFTGIFTNKTGFTYSFHSNGGNKLGAGFDMSTLLKFDLPNANKSGSDESVDTLSQSSKPISVTNKLNNKVWEIPYLYKNNTQLNYKSLNSVLGTQPTIDPWQIRSLYSIVQIIPSQQAGYLTKYQIIDNLNSAWQIDAQKDIQITDENSQDVTSQFQLSINANNQLLIDATSTSLQSKNFYGHTYTINIKGCLNKNNIDNWQGSLQGKPTDEIAYLKLENKAQVNSQVQGQSALSTTTNTATNNIKVNRPVITTEQSNYNGDKSIISGDINDQVWNSKNSAYWDFYITYLDNKRMTVTKPWKIKNADATFANRLLNISPGTSQKWQAQLPDDILVDPYSYYSQNIIITVKDQEGLANQTTFHLGPWWTIANNVLTIYPHELNLNTDKLSTSNNYYFPWSSSDIVHAVIKDNVTAKESLAYLFYNCSQLQDIIGLNNINTNNVTSMNDMFNGCSSLNKIDLSSWDMSNAVNVNNMFTKTNNLWQITLGSKNAIYDSGLLNAPGGGRAFPEDSNYVSKTSNWQEVGNGDTYNPAGPIISALEIMTKYQNGSDKTRTYVWQPFLAGDLILNTVPKHLDYGSGFIGMNYYFETSDPQKFTVIDNRPLRNGRQWHINVTASTLHSGKHEIKGSPLKFNGMAITNSPIILHSATSTLSTTNYSWEYKANNGIKLELDHNSVPAAGNYQGSLTYTIVDSLN